MDIKIIAVISVVILEEEIPEEVISTIIPITFILISPIQICRTCRTKTGMTKDINETEILARIKISIKTQTRTKIRVITKAKIIINQINKTLDKIKIIIKMKITFRAKIILVIISGTKIQTLTPAHNSLSPRNHLITKTKIFQIKLPPFYLPTTKPIK